MFFITESKELKSVANAETEQKVGTTTEWGQLYRVYFAHGFSWIGIQTMFVYIIAFIQQKYFNGVVDQEIINAQSGQIIAISFAVLNTIGFILPAFVLEPIVEKIGRVKTHIMCVAIMSLGYFGIVFLGKSPFILYVLMAVAGIGWAAVVSLPFAIMTEKIDQSRTGFFMGIFNLSVVLPQLLVSLAVGTIIKNAADKNVIFLISGVSLAFSAIFWMLVKEKRTRSTKDTNTPQAAH
jgi:MFS family permease